MNKTIFPVVNCRRLALAAAGAAAVAVVSVGVAYATIPGPGNVYSACMLAGVGQVRLIDKSLPSTSPMSRCTDRETEVSWNQAGQPGPAGPPGAKGDPGARGTNGTNGKDGADGKDGLSVTTAPEPAGTNCAAGGVALNAVNGVRYVCNGKAGADGTDGADGHGLSSLADLDGLPCEIPPSSAPGVLRVNVDSGATSGVVGGVTLRCEPVAGTTVLSVSVSAQCTGASGSCAGHDSASVSDGHRTCAVTATSPSVVSSNGCSFAYLSGTDVQLTASTPSTAIWGGACAGVTGAVCSFRATGSTIGVSLTY